MIRTQSILALAIALSVASFPTAQDCDQNGVVDTVEFANQPFLDSNSNGVKDLCEGLSVDTMTISLSAGGTQTLRAELGPSFGGFLYWMMGSTAGEAPGTNFGTVMMPLNWDGMAGYMSYTIKNANDGVLSSGVGFLDSKGSATARFDIAPGTDPSLAGLEVRHAYAILPFGSDQFFWASNAVTVKLVP